MPLVSCPNCGEDERLRGETVDDAITITCEPCGAVWERDLAPRCGECGRDGVRPAMQAILDKSRGNQLSIQSMRVRWLCPDCDADTLRRYLESNVPLPPPELPVDPDP